MKKRMSTDQQIVTAMAENPEQGFKLLMGEYGEPVYWHIRRMVVAHDDAQDAAQETFLRVFRSFGQYDPQQSLKSWLFRIATNEALRLLGRRQGKVTLSLEESVSDTIHLRADEYFDYGDKLAVKLQRAIQTLPLKQRLAFTFRYYDELSYEEIAAVTDTTAASAKANYHLAKEKIIRYMNDND